MYKKYLDPEDHGFWTDTGAGEEFPKGSKSNQHAEMILFPSLARPGMITHQSNVLQTNLDLAEHAARMRDNGIISAKRADEEIGNSIRHTVTTPVEPEVEGQKKAVLKRLQQLHEKP